MKIELETEQLALLIQSGMIHPSDIKCLDNETKKALKALCLKMCQPSNCIHCDARSHCLINTQASAISFTENVIKPRDFDSAQ